MKYNEFPSRMCALAFIEQIRSMFPAASILLIGGNTVAWSK